MAKMQTKRSSAGGSVKRGSGGATITREARSGELVGIGHRTQHGNKIGRSASSGEFEIVGPRGEPSVRIKVKAAMPLRAGQRYVLLDDPTTAGSDTSSAFEPSPWAQALLRGREMALADLKSCGGAYDLEQVRAMLGGISRSQVHAKVKDGKLLAIPGPSNHRHYPVVQFNARGELIEGLDQVQAALDDGPWIVLNFLIHPDARLQGRKPIELLEEGKVDVVVTAARRVGEAGA
jgi:hypothetical protein